MGKGKMDEAAAERIKKARGEKVSHKMSFQYLVILAPLTLPAG